MTRARQKRYTVAETLERRRTLELGALRHERDRALDENRELRQLLADSTAQTKRLADRLARLQLAARDGA